ncbi:MAG TPA: carboxylating nicotinate-nucleotide diphosphorylase [Lentimicrobium sp.]|jgi:nicotinate-nucleotide pyrophosphorylase (carboxylating)|nr:carboxylating nicotinate-nucleotide diphosphorylase [Lentimicrobium sp.]
MSIEEIIRQALAEDVGDGDHTSLSTIPSAAHGRARLMVKEKGVISGIDVAREVFRVVDPKIEVFLLLADGIVVEPGADAFVVEGPSRSILKAERLVLNFMQRMSGIATNTAKYVEKIKGTDARILDTRKTTPLLRELEKMAVRHGGGYNHRFGLYDMIMIKDNHVDFAGGITRAIESANHYMQEKGLRLPVEIEVRNLDELNEVLQTGGVTRIMLDNFSPELLRKAVELIYGRFETEASGGITLETIREYAETGVDFISVGALTHHIKSLDLSLKAY